MEGLLLQAGKQAAISMGSQALANEANAALGQTRKSGLQPNVFGGAIEGVGTGLLKSIEQQKAANVIKSAQPIAAPPPIDNRQLLDQRLNKVLGIA